MKAWQLLRGKSWVKDVSAESRQVILAKSSVASASCFAELCPPQRQRYELEETESRASRSGAPRLSGTGFMAGFGSLPRLAFRNREATFGDPHCTLNH